MNERERATQLNQKVRLNFETDQLMPDLKVIEMNSHYLEMVDKYYSSKGYLSFITFSFFLLSNIALIGTIFISFTRENGVSFDDFFFFAFVFVLFLPICLWMLFLLKKEWFAWTHYPIRFDRKNQLVHAHRHDGSVFSARWEDVFFTSAAMYGSDCYISGHVLADDGVTIVDTFCLPASHNNIPALKAHWEFVRRYMEEGPEGLTSRISFCLPIAEKKESYRFTFFYLMTIYNGAPIVLLPFLAPLAFLFSLPRYVAILTSRRPVWSEEIQAQCRVEDDDPYRLDATTNPKNLWRTFF
ncbi:hypothetical protein M0K80_RS16275 [Providencia rettgeri]|nr:hypothetical protein [Providencia rettgeri]ELR5139616.1 hypothetical protein [Providencia rettgeri]ELR5167847.1 hypothetical protein [Providencia rettgeri]QLQ95728.1 hypothetical protein H0907_07295 [Providencia rettgeri]HCH7935777.1 hypothetical protein [Providencia rettgeri]